MKKILRTLIMLPICVIISLFIGLISFIVLLECCYDYKAE